MTILKQNSILVLVILFATVFCAKPDRLDNILSGNWKIYTEKVEILDDKLGKTPIGEVLYVFEEELNEIGNKEMIGKIHIEANDYYDEVNNSIEPGFVHVLDIKINKESENSGKILAAIKDGVYEEIGDFTLEFGANYFTGRIKLDKWLNRGKLENVEIKAQVIFRSEFDVEINVLKDNLKEGELIHISATKHKKESPMQKFGPLLMIGGLLITKFIRAKRNTEKKLSESNIEAVEEVVETGSTE